MLQGNLTFVRLLAREDIPALLKLCVKNREYLAPFEPLVPDIFYTLSGQEEAMEKVIANHENDQGYSFGIFVQETGELIGRIGLSNITRGAWQNCTMGYFVDEDMQGEGYVTEAVKLVLYYAFQELGLHRVEAGAMPRNRGSIRVLEKAGFHYIGLSRKHIKINGEWEDHRLYAITVEDWHNQ